MATTQEYDDAVDAVRNGTATPRQRELVDRQAGQAGYRGSAARAARDNAKK